jgi:hypothetical protein
MATAPTPNGDRPSRTIIDKNGDVLLQLGGKDSGLALNLLVSSRTLSLASSVFRAMFNGHFAEGQDLSSASPRVVPLPDDDSRLMEILCNIFHLRMSEVPEDLNAISLADLAILCDKYDCREGVRFHAKVWISQLLLQLGDVGFEKLLFVTYMLDLPAEFYNVTLSLIRDRATSIKAEVAGHGQDMIPLGVFGKLSLFCKLHQESKLTSS